MLSMFLPSPHDRTKWTLLSGTQYWVWFRALGASPTLKINAENGSEQKSDRSSCDPYTSPKNKCIFLNAHFQRVFVHNLRLKAGSQISSWMSSVLCVFRWWGALYWYTKSFITPPELRTTCCSCHYKLTENIFCPKSETWFSWKGHSSNLFCFVLQHLTIVVQVAD